VITDTTDKAPFDGTPSQNEWITIANKARELIETKINDIPKMTGGELYDFARAVREFHFLEVNARSFDATVEQKEKGFS